MKCLVSDQGTAATETFICGTCFYGPQGKENQAYVREQASQSDDVNPQSKFVDCTGNDAAGCCICGVFEIVEDDENESAS